MRPSQFEEKEYEAPLYNQLERGDRRLWAPGQVLEHHIGFDRGIYLVDRALWLVLGHQSVPTGLALARYPWFTVDMIPAGKAAPNFRLNLFLQAKRPFIGARPSKQLRAHGVSGHFWKFEVEDEQQRVLEQLAAGIGARGHVCYASAVFHTHQELYKHTRKGTIAANSTFPSATSLVGHEAWYYNEPGAKGVANPRPEQISEPPLSERIGALLRETSDSSESNDWNDGLSALANAVTTTLNSDSLPDTARRARVFDSFRALDRLLGGSRAAMRYARVAAFSVVYDLHWLVVGDG